MGAVRTTIYLEEKDRRALRVIQDQYGLATLSDAIRFSIRVVQGLDPPESAVARHLPAGRGQPRTPEPETPKTVIARARQARHTAEQVIVQTTAILNRLRYPTEQGAKRKRRTP